MKGHLSESTFVDILEGTLGREERDHLRDCAACAHRLEELEGILGTLKASDVPEPQAFYWQSQRQRIRERLEERRPSGWRWVWMPGLAVAGAAALGLVLWLPAGPASERTPAIPAWTASPESEEAAIATIRGLSPAAEDLASAASTSVTDQIANLSDEESQALVGALKSDIGSGKL